MKQRPEPLARCQILSARRADFDQTSQILVVDDFIDSADAVTLCLNALGLDARAAYGGRQALAVAQQWHPTHMVLDIMMPDLMGFDVAMILRSTPSTAATMLLAYTALNSPEDRDRIAAAGFDALCTKPADPVELVRLFGQMSGRRAHPPL